MSVETCHKSSSLCLDTSVSLFDVPSTQISYDNVTEIEIFPSATIIQDNDITFMINSLNSQSYLDLNSAYFLFNLQIKRSDGMDAVTKDGETTKSDEVTVSNGFGSTFIKHITVQANDVTLSKYDSFFMRNYMDCLLHSNDDHSHQLETCQFYYKNECVGNDHTNESWSKRFERTKESKKFSLIVPFNTELASSGKLTLPGVNLKITISLSQPGFHLVASPNEKNSHRVVINDVKMIIKKWIVSPSVAVSHENLLREKNATVVFRNFRSIDRVIPAGVKHISFDNLFSRIAPYNIYCLIQDSSTFLGKVNNDPTVFKRNGLSSMILNYEEERI